MKLSVGVKIIVGQSLLLAQTVLIYLWIIKAKIAARFLSFSIYELTTTGYGPELLSKFYEWMVAALQDTHFAHEISEEIQSAYKARHVTPHAYNVGDLLWIDNVLFVDYIAKSQIS